MEYKKNYTEEEVNEIFAWMKEHIDQLPKTMRLDGSAYTSDLRKTVEYLMGSCENQKTNPTFSASIYHLFLIREKILSPSSADNEA